MRELMEVLFLTNEGFGVFLILLIGILFALIRIEISQGRKNVKKFLIRVGIAAAIALLPALFMMTEATKEEKKFSDCVVKSIQLGTEGAEALQYKKMKEEMDQSFGGFKKYEYSIVKENFKGKHSCEEETNSSIVYNNEDK